MNFSLATSIHTLSHPFDDLIVETDVYITAAETDGSTYFTALDSEGDSVDKSGSEEPSVPQGLSKDKISEKNQPSGGQQIKPHFIKISSYHLCEKIVD